MGLRPKPVRTVLFFAAVACLAHGVSLDPPAPRAAARAWIFEPPWTEGAGLPADSPPIPDASPPEPEPLPPRLEPLRDRLIRPRTREWKYIILHHSATARGNAEMIDKEHREVKGWDGLGYQFVIGNGNGAPAGGVEVGFRWVLQREGAHAGVGAREHNEHGIGICVVGNYDAGEMPEEAYASLRELTSWLARRHSISPDRILPHSKVRPDPTACPGKNFPLERLRRDVEADLRD